MATERQVCVVTDSTADIPPELARELGVTVVPLSFSIGGETFRDGEIPMSEFFERMRQASALPTTSQPPVGVFVEVFKRLLERCREVVSINISGRLSGTLESAREAARQVGERVHVLDSRSLSWGEGFQVIEAARAAAAGASAQEVKSLVDRVRERVHLVVGLDSLENLAKGGRIGRVSALLGGMLKVRVLLSVDREGAFEPVGRVRGTDAAMLATVDWIAARVGAGRKIAVAVLHAASPDKAAWLAEQVRTRFAVSELHIVETGPVIGSHTGTGWGLAALELD